MILKEGDILYCKKDFQCGVNSRFICNKGSTVKISEIHNEETVAYYIDNGVYQTWIIVKRCGKTNKSYLDYSEYFEDKIKRAKRIAKEYINEF